RESLGPGRHRVTPPMNPASVPHRPVGVLVTHAALGKELLRTVEGILGAQADAYVLSNDGYSGEALSRAIEERVHGVPVERPVVLFTDLAAGSCGIATRRAEVISIPEALRESTLQTIRAERSFLLFPSVLEPLRLKEGGFPLEEVNVGGLHHAPGKSAVLPYVYLDQGDREKLLALSRLGV